jgi:site-specific DNA recombinase
VQGEIDRRIREAKKADPVRQREQYLNREQSRLQNKIDRLLTAYQEELITLEQLRQRIPELRKQEKAVCSELESLHMAATDQARYLRVVDSLSKFRARLQGNAERLDFVGRRKIIRLLVREILIGGNTITIRHSIPPTNSPSTPTDPGSPSAGPSPSPDQRYRLCTRDNRRPLRRASTIIPIPRASMLVSTLIRFFHRSFQPHLDQMEHGSVDDPASHRL